MSTTESTNATGSSSAVQSGTFSETTVTATENTTSDNQSSFENIRMSSEPDNRSEIAETSLQDSNLTTPPANQRSASENMPNSAESLDQLESSFVSNERQTFLLCFICLEQSTGEKLPCCKNFVCYTCFKIHVKTQMASGRHLISCPFCDKSIHNLVSEHLG